MPRWINLTSIQSSYIKHPRNFTTKRMASDDSIKIAIIGGGLAGATLANALLKYTHLSVHIFESAPEFSERGAAVGIAINGQAALAEIGGVVADVIERAAGVTMTSSRLCMASGPSAMSLVFDLAGEQRGKVVHRASLLTELLRPLDEGTKHTKKKVVNIDDDVKSDHKLVVEFEDGTKFHVDAVIGADGVRGYMRGHVLGKNHPAAPAQRASFWDARSLIPMQVAKELLGEEYFQIDRQYGWVGDGGFFMHDVLDGGETVQCVLAKVIDRDDDWAEDEWSKKLDRLSLDKAMSSWTDTTLKNGIIEIMLQNSDLKAFAETHHQIDAPTYSKGRVCIMGDAAHAMTPWQGSGAGMAIEDAMILETLLGNVTTPSQIDVAFQVYDRVRRPRTQRVVHSSYRTGMIISGRNPDTGLDFEKIKEAFPKRWEFIYGQDQAESKREALAAFNVWNSHK